MCHALCKRYLVMHSEQRPVYPCSDTVGFNVHRISACMQASHLSQWLKTYIIDATKFETVPEAADNFEPGRVPQTTPRFWVRVDPTKCFCSAPRARCWCVKSKCRTARWMVPPSADNAGCSVVARSQRPRSHAPSSQAASSTEAKMKIPLRVPSSVPEFTALEPIAENGHMAPSTSELQHPAFHDPSQPCVLEHQVKVQRSSNVFSRQTV